MARAEAMQAGGTIGVAKVEVISQDNGTGRLRALAMRAVDTLVQKVDSSRQ
jgi:hypothetical protein